MCPGPLDFSLECTCPTKAPSPPSGLIHPGVSIWGTAVLFWGCEAGPGDPGQKSYRYLGRDHVFSASDCTRLLILLPDQDGGERSLARSSSCPLSSWTHPRPFVVVRLVGQTQVPQGHPRHPSVFKCVVTHPGGHAARHCLGWGQLQTLPLDLSMPVAKDGTSTIKYVHSTCPLWALGNDRWLGVRTQSQGSGPGWNRICGTPTLIGELRSCFGPQVTSVNWNPVSSSPHVLGHVPSPGFSYRVMGRAWHHPHSADLQFAS